MIYSFDGTRPDVHPEAFVCREATLVGDVTVQRGASVWPGAVLRGDISPVRVGRRTHVEENCVVHQGVVGDGVILGHGAVSNVATIGDRTLIGMNATVNRDVRIGAECIVAPGAVVPEGHEIPDRSLVRGIPATCESLDEVPTDAEAIFETYSTQIYDEIAGRHNDLFGNREDDEEHEHRD